ncbi:MAG: hypothetical protein LRZ92_04015 [Methanosarcinaceae archaeon]|jgi:UPF0148 protein|nr:hypothetical protein [Methanosarcinaceae archaeon]NKQ37926.1 hypothetical protein [Methanosarcinales archaeon]
MNSNNDLNVKKISKMLEIGGTMLAKHCDTCGAPIFRYRGKELCPICKNDEKQNDLSDTFNKNQKHFKKDVISNNVHDKKDFVKNIDASKKNKEYTKIEPTEVCNDAKYAEKLILEKIITISQNMQCETEYVRILEHIKLIKQCINIVEKLKELQQ